MPRPRVTLRSRGLITLDDEAVVRFGTTEPHQVIKSALATCDLYGEVLVELGLPAQHVLVLSCFAETEQWPVARLSAGTDYRTYCHIRAGEVTGLGYELWPTDVIDAAGDPDPRNNVHVDIVLARGIELGRLVGRTGTTGERRALRQRLIPHAIPLLDAFGGPTDLP